MSKSTCSKHQVIGNKTITKMVNMIANARYDVTAKFLDRLSNKLYKDSMADKKRGRKRLAANLEFASFDVAHAGQFIHKAWDISKPFMKTRNTR